MHVFGMLKHDVQRGKITLMPYANSEGPDETEHLRTLMKSSLVAVAFCKSACAFAHSLFVDVQSNLDGSNTDDSFTMANSNSFFESLRNSCDSSRKQIFKEIFLFYCEIVFCVYSLESPHRGDSNEYTQNTITVLKIEKIYLNYRYLLPELVP